MNERYSRQVLFNGIGAEGQRRLLESRVLIVGCGALGTAHAESLARAGVGRLRIADRDFVEASNLQRQTMFTERDASERLPKAIAAANHIREINGEVEVEPEITDVNHSNIERLVQDCNVVMDGTDNFATRYLINDACVKHQVDWIYGAAVGSYGVTMTIQPHQTPCLRCVFEEAPPAASAPTCDTAGVIMPIISVVSAVQVAEALKLLTGQNDNLHRSLMQFDVWRNEWRKINPGPPSAECPTCDTAGVIMPIISIVAAVQVSEALKLLTGQSDQLHNSLMQFDVWRNEWRKINPGGPLPACPSCGLRDFQTLDPVASEFAAVLCGRNAVQISPAQPTQVNFPRLAERLSASGDVKFNDYLLRFRAGDYELTIFQDARSIIRGTDEITTARSLYAKYIGN